MNEGELCLVRQLGDCIAEPALVNRCELFRVSGLQETRERRSIQGETAALSSRFRILRAGIRHRRRRQSPAALRSCRKDAAVDPTPKRSRRMRSQRKSFPSLFQTLPYPRVRRRHQCRRPRQPALRSRRADPRPSTARDRSITRCSTSRIAAPPTATISSLRLSLLSRALRFRKNRLTPIRSPPTALSTGSSGRRSLAQARQSALTQWMNAQMYDFAPHRLSLHALPDQRAIELQHPLSS